MPKVSILIPTYNRADYLRDAMQSAVAQTERDTEIIVLDDASPDHTAQIVMEFAEDRRIRYIRHPHNIGIAANWRNGISIAKGQFFCLLHDDDTFEPEFVEALMPPLLEQDNLIFAFCDHWMMNPEGCRSLTESNQCSSRFKRDCLKAGTLDDLVRAALVDGSPPIGATLFRKSMVDTSFISDEAKGSIDAWLFYQCVRTGHAAYYVPQRLMNYRAHPGGMSSSMPLYMGEGHVFRYQAMLNDPMCAPVCKDIKKLLAKTYVDNGINLMAKGETELAKRAFREALHNDVSLRALVAYSLTLTGGAGKILTNSFRKMKHRTS